MSAPEAVRNAESASACARVKPVSRPTNDAKKQRRLDARQTPAKPARAGPVLAPSFVGRHARCGGIRPRTVASFELKQSRYRREVSANRDA